MYARKSCECPFSCPTHPRSPSCPSYLANPPMQALRPESPEVPLSCPSYYINPPMSAHHASSQTKSPEISQSEVEWTPGLKSHRVFEKYENTEQTNLDLSGTRCGRSTASYRFLFCPFGLSPYQLTFTFVLCMPESQCGRRGSLEADFFLMFPICLFMFLVLRPEFALNVCFLRTEFHKFSICSIMFINLH